MDIAEIIKSFGGLTPMMGLIIIIVLFVIRDLKAKKAVTDTEGLGNTMILVGDKLGERLAVANERIAEALDCICEMQKTMDAERRRVEHDRGVVEQFKKDQGMKT